MAEVDVWRAENEANEANFQELRLLFLDMKGLSYYQQVGNLSTESSWKKLQVTHRIKKTRSINYLPYAASIAIVLSTIIGIYFYQNQTIEPQVAVATEIRNVPLSDGSIVTLNAGAKLQYLESIHNNERRVQLQGDGYFDVAKNLDAPFVVEIEDVEVRVLGTKFYINQVKDQLIVDVEEGKVLVSYGDQHKIVESSQSLAVDQKAKEFVEALDDEAGVSTFWKTRMLVFDQTALEEVADVINQTYDTSIEVRGSSSNCLLTVTFENESIENILEVVSSTLGFTVSNEQGVIVLEGNGCE